MTNQEKQAIIGKAVEHFQADFIAAIKADWHKQIDALFTQPYLGQVEEKMQIYLQENGHKFLEELEASLNSAYEAKLVRLAELEKPKVVEQKSTHHQFCDLTQGPPLESRYLNYEELQTQWNNPIPSELEKQLAYNDEVALKEGEYKPKKYKKIKPGQLYY